MTAIATQIPSAIADIDGLQDALDAKAPDADLTTHTGNTTDAHDLTNRLAAKAAASHVHAGTDITSGTVADARLSSNIPLKNASNTFTATNLQFKTVTGGASVWGLFSDGGGGGYFQVNAFSTSRVLTYLAGKAFCEVNVNSHIYGDSASTLHQFRGNVELLDAVNMSFNTGTGSKIGTATGQKLAFHNSLPVIQRASAAQAAVATTGATQATPWGFSTAAQADALVTLVNEILAALVEKGLIKGSA